MRKIPIRIILFSLVVAIIIFIAFIVFFLLKGGKNDNVPSPIVPSSNKVLSPIQKTSIGITSEKEVASLPSASKIALPNSDAGYSLPSSLKTRPNVIGIKNGFVSYERETTSTNPSSPTYLTLSKITYTFGEPEKVINGSNYYGSFLSTYIYASRGFSVVANPNTDEVYEVQFFAHTTPNQYVKLFGEDINPQIANPRESF